MRFWRLAAVTPVILLSLAAGGCWTPLYNRDPSLPVAEQPFDAPQVAVEFQSASGKVKRVPVPLEAGMAAQDAIDKTKAGKHFGRCDIDLVRPGTLSPEPVKMPLAWDNDRKRVAHSTNYALHPGDRIVVRENTSSALDDMLAKVMGQKKAKTRR
jgi:hypothetical protein